MSATVKIEFSRNGKDWLGARELVEDWAERHGCLVDGTEDPHDPWNVITIKPPTGYVLRIDARYGGVCRGLGAQTWYGLWGAVGHVQNIEPG